MSRTHHHSLAWRVTKAIEHAGENRPLITRTGPAWGFGIIGVIAEFLIAPLVLGITITVGLITYLVLDTPLSKVRAQQRPRFVSVRILYLNTMIIAGFWLAVMFTFSAADPAISKTVDQRLPQLLDVATQTDLRALVMMQKRALSAKQKPVAPVGAESTWFDVFIHGVISALALNFMLYGVVIARRRRRSRAGHRRKSRKSLRYDSSVRLFVDDEPPVAQ